MYYVLNDPGGQSVTFVKSDTQESGSILVDPLGNVISNTLPATLLDSLAGHLDPATGLQYHGDRYYDAWLGGYTQPNSFGGLPGMPQSLNRFSAVSGMWSPSTLTEARATSPLVVDVGGSVLINSAKAGGAYSLASSAIDSLRSIRARSLTRATIETSVYLPRVIKENVPINPAFDAAIGLGYLGLNRLRGKLPSLFFDAAQQSLDTTLIKNTHQIERTVWERVAIQQFGGYRVSGSGRLAGLLLSKYGKHGLDLGFGLVIDVGWQGVIDLPLVQQGQITEGQYWGRLGVTAAGSAGSWLLGVGAGSAVTLAYTAVGLTPPGLVVGGTVIVVGIAANVFFDIKVAPALFERYGLNPEE